MSYSKSMPDLKRVEAERMLAMRFSEVGDIDRIDKLLDFCRRKALARELPNTYARLQRYRLSLVIVDIVISSLPPERRNFILRRFKHRQNNVCIEEKCRLTHSVQNKWSKEFMQELITAEDYRLSNADVYRLCKVLNMLHVLDERINTFVDSDIPCNQAWLTNMMVRRHKYRELLTVMQGIMESARTAEPGRQGYTYYQVVKAKMQHSDEPSYLLADRLGISDGTVSKHLRKYESIVNRYLV